MPESSAHACCNKSKISEVLYHKLLSVTLEKNISYDSHMDELVIKKLSKSS